ncbi:hypothetical protein [Aliiroseovarius crassostreae]|nr:hypothetical protein [Aliiroseovarius crassostreae]UWQ03718.1 hypothetical protein K3X22_08305 [Aliiroseovarius crassostreae]
MDAKKAEEIVNAFQRAAEYLQRAGDAVGEALLKMEKDNPEMYRKLLAK